MQPADQSQQTDSQNNNSANYLVSNMQSNFERSSSTERTQGPLHGNAQPGQSCNWDSSNQEPELSKNEALLAERIELLQGFMVEKGLMDPNMSNEDLRLTLNESLTEKTARPPDQPRKGKEQQSKGGQKDNGLCDASSSEVTIYKRAIEQIASQLNDKIENFIQQTRQETTTQQNGSRKVSTSSEEFMDTSDETMEIDNSTSIVDQPSATPAKGKDDANVRAVLVRDPEPTSEDCLDQIV